MDILIVILLLIATFVFVPRAWGIFVYAAVTLYYGVRMVVLIHHLMINCGIN